MEEFTIKQVAEHNSPKDAWLIIHGQDHPGGADVLTEAAGTDASEDFDNAGHSEDAFEIMKDCCIGKIQGFEKKKPKLKPLAPVKAVKIQTRGSSSISTLVNLGFIVCAGAGAYYFTRRQGFTVPDWLLASLRSDSTGSSFIKGIIVGGGSLATANAVAAQRFTSMAMKSKPFTSYPAHMKVPKRAQEDTLLQRGLLDPVTYSPLPLKQKTLIAPNVYRLTFSLPTTSTILGLPIGQHVTIKADVDGESVARSYTPVSNNSDLGVLELVIKAYPDGKLTSKYLAKLEVGDEVLFRGPKGAMKYQPNLCKKIGMIAGGTGITPMFQVIRAICEHDRDTTEISLIYANRTEQDILLREELDRFARRYPKNFKVHYMLDQPPANWEFGSGYVTRELMKEKLPSPSAESRVFLCGPPGMVNASKKALVDLGFEQPGASAKMSDQTSHQLSFTSPSTLSAHKYRCGGRYALRTWPFRFNTGQPITDLALWVKSHGQLPVTYSDIDQRQARRIIGLRSLDPKTVKMPFTAGDICKIIFAIILPPVGVFMERGCGGDFWINLLLTILFFVPGLIHALYIILKY
ncbi:hypothetical protein FOXB_12086 [Fusarium oxysporum f. sp. conglutinans Fo5176]|uniref:Cytochrome-b5 reductase n=4 Tax=Fusarium oxysporum TaxID=5507 RepID=F9G0A4_FUSOF|nr:hypothetical protein FOXB_12086 [Fusarium oxysporum f. sp. conglutinans Fo5176]